MPSALTSLSYHLVFSTKFRRRTLTDVVRADTYAYIAGIITNKEGQLIEIGGTDDHIHILTSCSPRVALSDLVRDIKTNSSKWLNDQEGSKWIGWQTGYGGFTVSRSMHESVRHYIRHQAEHHRQQSFADEFRAMLRRHDIAFDEQYLFEMEHLG